MTDNRIKLRMEPELTPVRLEDKVDLDAEIKVAVDSHVTGLGAAGLVVMGLGMLSLVIGTLMFAFGYPERMRTPDVTWEQAKAYGKAIALFVGAGVVLLFLGTSMFFYGRTVLGSGRLDQFNLEEPLEVEV